MFGTHGELPTYVVLFLLRYVIITDYINLVVVNIALTVVNVSGQAEQTTLKDGYNDSALKMIDNLDYFKTHCS